MKGIFSAIVLSTIALIGCAQGSDDHVVETTTKLQCPAGSAYQFRVKADVDACEVEGLSSALEKWNHETRDVFPFTVAVDPTPEMVPESCVVFVYNDTGPGDGYFAWAGSTWNSKERRLASGTIRVRINSIGPAHRIDPVFCTSLMLHETGHLLGLEHDTSKDHETIMTPGLQSDAGTMGCEDVRRVCKIWGCTPRCSGNGWVR